LTKQEYFDNFIVGHGGRTKFYELIEETAKDPESMFALELNALIERNVFAQSRIADILRAIKTDGQFGEELQKQFQGTSATHGASTADDFFKAKSEEYLQNAEFIHAMDEKFLNEEEGWPYSDKDISEA